MPNYFRLGDNPEVTAVARIEMPRTATPRDGALIVQVVRSR